LSDASCGSRTPSATWPARASSSGPSSLRRSTPYAIVSTSSRARARRRRASSPAEASHCQCRSSASSRSLIPSEVVATVCTTGGFQAADDSATMCFRSRTVAAVSGRSALFTTRTSAISSTPAFAAWIESPIPGTTTTTVESAAEAISTSACPTPTVSTRMTEKPAASRTRIAIGAVADRPPSWPLLAIDRMNTPESIACPCIRTRSPSSAPPENGDDGSTASTATCSPRARRAATSAFVVVDLPAPGAPVSPITRGAPGGRPAPLTSACSALARRLAAAASSLRIRRPRPSPFSIHEIARASALASLASTRSAREPMSVAGSPSPFSAVPSGAAPSPDRRLRTGPPRQGRHRGGEARRRG
jgi:hypothetical protein